MKTDRPDTRLAISYAPRGREGVAALLALDDRLADIVRRANDPLVGQMRLTWWREALEALDRGAPPAEPILRALAEHALPHGATGAALAEITDGWEALLEEPFGHDAIERHSLRGAALFAVLGQITGAADDAIAEAGRGWALADLAGHLGEAGRRDEVAAMARPHLKIARNHRWSRAGRAIGALALLAQQELDDAAPAARVSRLLRLRLIGR
jgi:phytoene synthase